MGTETGSGEPMLLLQERHGQRRYLPIWIGGPEAVALSVATEKVATPRPLTHRLLLDVLDAFAVELERVRITSLVDGQFHAELDLAHTAPGAGGTGPVVVSARASDAVTLALRRGCVIEVHETVLDEAALPAAPATTPEDAEKAAGVDPTAIEDQVEQLRQALTEAGPEDFDQPSTGPDDDPPDGPT